MTKVVIWEESVFHKIKFLPQHPKNLQGILPLSQRKTSSATACSGSIIDSRVLELSLRRQTALSWHPTIPALQLLLCSWKVL